MARKRFGVEKIVAVLWRNYPNLSDRIGIADVLKSTQTLGIATVDTIRTDSPPGIRELKIPCVFGIPY